MPLFLIRSLLILLLAALSGCSSYELAWRTKAIGALQQLDRDDAAKLMPDAYSSIKKAYQQGEEILKQEEDEELADLQFQLAFQKGQILTLDLAAYKSCLAEKAIEEAAEAEELRLEEESKRLALAALEEENRKKQASAKTKSKGNGLDNGSNSARDRHQLPATYTVRRGETLPQIAARPEVYNDSSLWQIIYKANRDQVRDPYQLWPGQVLKIPRSYSRDEASDARKLLQRH